MSIAIPITLKWGKKTYDNEQLSIQCGSSAHTLKEQVQSITGVPISRQKLLSPKIWKGPLKEDDVLPNNITLPKGKNSIIVTLIGSADILVEKPLDERPLFSEDMTPEEIWKATRNNTSNEEEDFIDIIALQKEVGFERDDGKAEMYQYNRLVTGLPQHQINDMLMKRKKKILCGTNNERDELIGDVAMTMGMELRRAYINSLAVLPISGTIVSGLDDGHVQLWRRGQLIKDARHTSAKVDHVLSFPSSTSPSDDGGPAFVTAGDGSICLWTDEGNHLMQFSSYPGTSPSSIAVGSVGEGAGSTKYLAACFKITRQVDPNQFRLVPQNETERRRREAAEVQEQMIQNELERVSKVIKIWFYNEENQQGIGVAMRESVISPHTLEDSAPITKLLDMNGQLVCGDAWGGIQIFQWISDSSSNLQVSRQQSAHMQFRGFSIACMEKANDFLAVSVQSTENIRVLPAATALDATCNPCGIYLLDIKHATIKAVLDAHSDSVQCMCQLPDGGLLSGGGRMDAKVRVWDQQSVSNAILDANTSDGEVKVLTESKVMSQPGYVFDLKVLPDSNGSDIYAIVAARYNVVKIVI